MTIEKVNMKSKQEKLLLFSPAIFFQEGIIMMVKKIDAIRTKELMDELRFGTDASACFKMLFLVLSAQENIAGKKSLAHSYNVVRKRLPVNELRGIPGVIEGKDYLLRELYDLLKESTISEFNRAITPFAIKSFDSVMERVSKVHEDNVALQALNIALLLESADKSDLDAFKDYKLVMDSVHAAAMDEKDFSYARLSICNYNVSKSKSKRLASEEEIYKLLSGLFLSYEQIMQIVINIKTNWKTLSEANIPVNYLSKIITGDAKLFKNVKFEETIGKVIEQFSDKTSIAGVYEAMLRTRENADNGKTECGFILPWLGRRVNGSGTLIINPTPAFISEWKSQTTAEPVFAFPDQSVVRAIAKEMGVTAIYTGDVESCGREFDTTFCFARKIRSNKAENEKAVLSAFQAACAISKEVIVLHPDALFNKLFSSAKTEMDLSESLILPSKVFKGAETKKCISVFRNQGKTAEVCVSRVELIRNATALFLGDPERTTHYNIDAERLLKQSIRTAVKRWEESPAEERMRENAKEYKFSKEISFCYCEKSNEDGTSGVKLYVCRVPTEQQKKRNALQRGEMIRESITRAKSVPTAKVEEWIELEGAYRPKLRQSAIEEASKYFRDMSISVKTLWYFVYERLTINDEEKEIFKNALHGNDLGELMVGETDADAFEAATDSCEESETVWNVLEAVLKESVRKRLIKRNPIDDLYEEKRKEARILESVRALARRNYTDEEEQRIVLFLKHRFENDDDNRALAVLAMLFTGLPAKVIAELRWDDFVKIPYSENYQLIVNKCTGEKGETVWLTDEPECRRIPIMSALAVLLKEYRKKVKGDKTDKELQKRKIFLPEGKINAVDAIMRLYSQAEKEAGIERDVVTTPHSSTRSETDFGKYSGNRFRENFEYHCQTVCQMTEAETDYVLRRKMSDTFSNHYCDYGHECIQQRMAVKLDRWGRKYMSFAKSDKDKEVRNKSRATINAMPQNDADAAVQFDVHAKGGVEITAEAAHGVKYNILVKEVIK